MERSHKLELGFVQRALKDKEEERLKTEQAAQTALVSVGHEKEEAKALVERTLDIVRQKEYALSKSEEGRQQLANKAQHTSQALAQAQKEIGGLQRRTADQEQAMVSLKEDHAQRLRESEEIRVATDAKLAGACP